MSRQAQRKRALCWIRRDLRLSDHRALAEATKAYNDVAVVFIFDTNILKRLKDENDRRVTFIHQSLVDIDEQLRKKGSTLLVSHGDPCIEIPRISKQLQCEAVYYNRDYEPYAKKRDAAIQAKLKNNSVDFRSFKDQVIFEGKEIVTKAGKPYQVFTPYKNAWLRQLESQDYKEHRPNLKHLMSAREIKPLSRPWSLKKLGFKENTLWLQAGERAARKRLHSFAKHISRYADARNFPAVESGTSGLSVHSRFGTTSIRELVRLAKSSRSNGSQTWLSELIWRDFYQMILDQFPEVTQESFQSKYDQIEWPGSRALFNKWCRGETGYPIVDAAMRHFNATGWMHNRLRMIVASFLVKDLLVNWRWGEAYFARYLLDYDLAANNGGWQWCASTGCDAQPYFRIFNPVSQSKKYDPRGAFIRQHLPELSNFPDRYIHFPAEAPIKVQNDAGCVVGKQYPQPVVVHSVQRQRALKLFKGVR